jgi:hypothetical protein
MKVCALLAALLWLQPMLAHALSDVPHGRAGSECDVYSATYPEDSKVPERQRLPKGPSRMISCWPSRSPMPQ